VIFLKKFLTGLTMAAILGVGLAQQTFASEDEQFHVGETPLETFVDAETGVVVEKFLAPEETGLRVAALSAGWDLVGSEGWVMNGNYLDTRIDGIYYSTGGDYMFRVPAHLSTWKSGTLALCDVTLYEYDETNADEIVAGFTVKPSGVAYDYIVRSIGSYVDGTNGKAEFYTTHSSNYKVVNEYFTVGYYD
jgi:hypothetical protein